jgi:outer membrane protein insertion porin family
MTMTKLKVAALLLAVSAVGVGAVVSRAGRGERAGGGTADVSAVASADPGNRQTAERYYAGGFRTTRGFEFGGDFQFLNSIEYQVPVRADDKLYVVEFVDSGTVESKAESRDYRVSAGSGLRIAVPALGPVPVRMDFGFPIIKPNEAGNREQVFSFFLGFTR